MRATEIQLETMRTGILDFFDQFVPALTVVVRHQRDDHGAVGEKTDTFANLTEIDLQGAIADELDIVESHHPGAMIIDRGIPRGDILDLGAQCFPDNAAPAGFEGAQHIDLFVGRRRAGQPERVGAVDAEEIGMKTSHIR